MTNKKFKTYQRGFTLIETLMAILVLMIALGGPYSISQRGLQAAFIAKDEDTAIFLAQDAVEYVRWVRDTNKLNGASDWLAGFDGTQASWSGAPTATTCTGSNSCNIDSLANTICQSITSPCVTMYYDASTNGYSASGSSGTGFTRTITLSSVANNSSEEMVTVNVSWKDPLSHSITVSEDIFNWQ